MTLILSAFLGTTAAAGLHWFSWWVRLHHLRWSLVLGALGASGVTALALVYVLASDISHLVQTPLVLFWLFAILLGAYQATSIPAPWWAGILGLLFELTMGFVGLSAINLSLQNLVLQWGLADRLPVIFAQPSRIMDQTICVFLITSLALALIRPIWRLRRR